MLAVLVAAARRRHPGPMTRPEPGRRRTPLPAQTLRVLLLAAGLPVVLVVGVAVMFLLTLAVGTTGQPLAPAVTSAATTTGRPAGNSAAPAGRTASPVPLPGSRAETVHPALVLRSGEPDTAPLAAIVAGRLFVTTWGSSSCPEVVVGLTVEDRRRATVDLRPADGPSCTADLGPRTVSVALDPAAVDLTAPLTVRLRGPGVEANVPWSTASDVEVLATPMV